jgi:ubiquitin carboxyl-terminal hydrolase 4/11/15
MFFPDVTNAETPSIDAQIKTVTTICEAAAECQPSDGEKMYLVSKRWLSRVQIRSTEARKNSKVEPEGEIGPIDNSDIIQQIIKDFDGEEHVQLKPGTGLADFTLFPEEAWTMVFDWYGLMAGSVPIVRFAHNTNPDKTGIPNVIFEFHPPMFTVHRLYGENNPINLPQKLKVTNPPAPILVFSRSTKYHDFLKRVKTVAGMTDMSKKVRLWRVPRIQPAAEPVPAVANTATPPSSRPSSPAAGNAAGPVQRQPQDSWTQLLLDVPEFVKLERGNGRELVDLPDQTGNAKYNGSSDLSIAGLGDDQTIVLDELISPGGDNYVSNYTAKGNKSTSTALTRSGAGQSNSQSNSGRNSPAPSGPMTRGRTQKTGRPVGTVGLSNLGNTCYMNSALQCVRSVEELTKYFLTGAAKNEINQDNPLGNNGDVALAYERLLEEIYKDPPPTSVAPRFFKTTIGRYAPSFSGYGQQDSQEFLGFLLDGLQEDLSRVKKKPYIEKPDSTDEMVNNPEAIREMAAKVWDISKKRDDSVISDLFTGMYKSTLVCPICAKVSITFDPFNNLTLQLPIENTWSHQVYYFPLNHRPILFDVDMDKQGSILALKQFISKRVGVPTERLFAAEEFKSKFYKTYDDFAVASEEIGGNDNVAIYELECKPTNWPSPRKPKQKKKSMLSFNYGNHNDSDEDDIPNWDDPLADRMLVPVFHRQPNTERTSRYNSRKPWAIMGAPHFITLTPEEARNEEAIKRKILEKVATFSTSQELAEDEDDVDEAEASAADSVDPDIVLTTGSDADSSGGSKVVATSIDGEDELVDVTMKDSNGAQEPSETTAEPSKSSEPVKTT